MTVEVVCCGEVLVDLVSTTPGASLEEASTFHRRAGGAPANVAVALARLGRPTAFMGGIAPDRLGRWLRRALQDEGVDVQAAVEIPQTQTRLAWITTDAAGDRHLAAFTHTACADTAFGLRHVRASGLATARWFHFGGVSLLSSPSAGATLRAAAFAREAGLRVSFDPNWRPALAVEPTRALEALHAGVRLAHVVKATRQELSLLAPGDTPHEALQRFGLDLLAVTDGAAPVEWCTGTESGTASPPDVDVIDTTGAGDAFTATLIDRVLERAGTAEAVRLACRAGALACTRIGAWDGLPGRAALEAAP